MVARRKYPIQAKSIPYRIVALPRNSNLNGVWFVALVNDDIDKFPLQRCELYEGTHDDCERYIKRHLTAIVKDRI